MANYNQPQIISLASYLKARVAEASSSISALTKADLAKDPAVFADALIAKWKVAHLELGQHKATIIEKAPHQVKVEWPVKGDSQLISMRASSGQIIHPERIRGQFITQILTYPASVIENEFNRTNAKQAIENDTALYKGQIGLLNAEIEKHNQLLAEKIPESVKLKYEALAKLKAAEDFLN